ncbi:DUF1538 domain-containing protein [Hydrogenovibrio kuenenii]|uniref:DUF1538 domain-containing protein n=1 Tax=Hydrogenovibrio kuenenii TaxID=63658 RepID=UPI000463B503|nr:DUF1538 domain-containing protein [Hydrogenovibrio kuenenii]
MKKISYHKIVQLERFNTQTITYNELTQAPNAAYQQIRVKPIDAYRLIKPYLQRKSYEQLRAVLPLALYLALFQVLILRQPVVDAGMIASGLVAVVLGLMLFMEGLRLGLMPFGEVMGYKLPQKATLSVVLSIAFLLGIGVTFAEPAIGALKAAGVNVDPHQAPYLYALLNQWTEPLVLVVGGGVGLAAVLGTLRFLNEWSLKPLIYLTLFPTLAVTYYIAQDPHLSRLIGLAWDCGAVTTGPVTVPLVLALGIGITSAAGSGNNSLSGFGIVTLASLFPILGVSLLSIYVQSTVSVADILSAVQQTSQVTTAWYDMTPFTEIIAGVRSIVPLMLFLALVLFVVLREKLPNARVVLLGLLFAVVGMIVFYLGLTYGLAKLGGQEGALIPAAFTQVSQIDDSPLYWFSLGILIVMLFAFFLGFGATMAEPALNALGATVERLTNGTLKKRTLMMAVAFGVGLGITAGVLKIVFDLPLVWLLLPSYGLALVLTFFSSEEFVNVAWDSAGVTTGPVTVPLVLAMGLGLGGAVGAVEGFGVLSMASIGPILSVMSIGLWLKISMKWQSRKAMGQTQKDDE